MSLLEEAMTSVHKKRMSALPEGRDAEELAIAWATGKVRMTQVGTALKLKRASYTNRVYGWLALRLRDAIVNGTLVVAKR